MTTNPCDGDQGDLDDRADHQHSDAQDEDDGGDQRLPAPARRER
jgi:hypothetical protein